jgi:hypothetical protein
VVHASLLFTDERSANAEDEALRRSGQPVENTFFPAIVDESRIVVA